MSGFMKDQMNVVQESFCQGIRIFMKIQGDKFPAQINHEK